MKLTTIIIFFLSITTTIVAQPGLDWVRTYDANGFECFQDIYAAENGDYLMCGSSGDRVRYGGRFWLLRTDDEGNIIWSNMYGQNNGGWFRSLIEADNRDIVTAGKTTGIPNTAHVNALRVNQEGEQVWYNEYAAGECRAIIETKEGNFLLAGETNRQGYLLMIDGGGDVIWQETYPIGDQMGAFGYFTSMRETDGEVVVAGEGRRDVQELWHIWLKKIDLEDGQEIWEQHLFAGRHSTCNTIITHPDGGFGLSGNSMGVDAYLMKVNDEGEEEWTRFYNHQMMVETVNCLAVLDNGEFALIGRGNDRDGHKPLVIRTFSDGRERWRGYYDFSEEEGYASGINELYSGVLDHENSLVVAGAQNTDGGTYDGLLFKAEPSINGPRILSWIPEDTLLTALPGDSILFAVISDHQWGLDLSIQWTFTDMIGTDTISTDDSVMVHFEEFGVYTVRGEVSDGETEVSVSWQIDVTQLYINSYEPDSLDIRIHRNTTVDFSVTYRAIEGNPVQYEWVYDGEILDEFDDSLSILFEQGRNHEVEVVAYRGDQNDNVIWQVTMLDLIVNYWPRELDIAVNIDTVMEFSIEPFNPEDPSLDILWTVDDDSVDNRSWTFINFDSVGEHQVSVYISDSTSADSMSWNVMVSPNNVSQYELALMPKTPTLYPPSPNPFNSQTSVRYALPVAGEVRLELFDVSGRLVSELVNQRQAAGWYDVVVDGSELVSGVYFVRMAVTDRMTAMKKIVLIK